MAGWHRIDADATASAYLQTFVSNLISAAVRLVPLGQTIGLQTLAALEPEVDWAASRRDLERYLRSAQ